MDEHMGDGDFVPFVPRRVSHASGEPPVCELPIEGPPPDEPEEVAHDTPASGIPSANDDRAVEPIPSDAPAHNGAGVPVSSTTDEILASTVEDVAAAACDHSLAIRNEAIRLAAIACGCALRHAVMLHPAVIARFVDDALAAAGHPAHARICVHPDSIAAITAPGHDRIADDRLSPGDVTVVCDDTSVGATLLERASLLVRAAAG